MFLLSVLLHYAVNVCYWKQESAASRRAHKLGSLVDDHFAGVSITLLPRAKLLILMETRRVSVL
jgi:hypothetical protein